MLLSLVCNIYSSCVHLCVPSPLLTNPLLCDRVGQPPLLQDAIVLAALGDYDETCYIPGKDIVFPAFIDHETLDGAIIKSSKRSYEVNGARPPQKLHFPQGDGHTYDLDVKSIFFCFRRYRPRGSLFIFH